MPSDPPVVHIGEVLPASPRLVAPGTAFTLFKLDDDNKLQVDDDSDFKLMIADSAKKTDYVDQLLDRRIVVVNDGSDPDYLDTFAKPKYPLKLIIKRKKYDLDIYPNDQTRDCEDAPFDFTGTEFTSTGLRDGDRITHLDLESDGSSTETPDTYDINASNAVITPPTLDKYNITYHKGHMTVTCCPWGGADSIPVDFVINYSEQTNPFNDVHSPEKIDTEGWARHSTLTHDATSNSLGDPFGRGSSGQSTAHVTVVRTSAHSIRVTATIISMGLPIESLTGDPVTRIRDIGCEDFLAGAFAEFFWTGQYFGGSVFGVVMVYHLVVRKH